jgi:tetratricopeptide (TPR) repeat protein
VDGTIEIKRGNFDYAQHLFARGEKYMAQVDELTLRGRLIRNVYTRSKSLYFYRTDDHEKAIALVLEALQINIELEKSGLHFLVFDRLSQLHNLSRIYFALDQIDKGVDVIASMLSTLMTGQSSLYMTDIHWFLENLTEEGKTMRSSFLCLIITETLSNLHKMSLNRWNEEGEVVISTFYSNLAQTSNQFKELTNTDQELKDWILIIQLFHQKQLDLFQERAIQYLISGRSFYNKQPNNIMATYLMTLTGPLMAG